MPGSRIAPIVPEIRSVLLMIWSVYTFPPKDCSPETSSG